MNEPIKKKIKIGEDITIRFSVKIGENDRPDIDSMTDQQLEEYIAQLEDLLDELEDTAPSEESGDAYDEWSDKYEELEDIIDEAEERLNELRG